MPEERMLHLFGGTGIELEYMIVDSKRLDVLPICDRVMAAEAGEITSEIEFPEVSWNNELVLHVLELKTTDPVGTFNGLADRFGNHIARVRQHLAPLGGTLMPTSMHPWMNPLSETRIWPHECNAIYEAFDRIFDCGGHGWSNLQCLHLNLPFANDEEFGRLHAAIRLLLPILPALAASSPIVERRVTGLLDSRLEAYRHNCARIPCVTGRVIPEPVFAIEEYQERILQGIYTALRPYDPQGILCHEWVNARGAIPRFERNSIEIRVLDVQECPAADLAIAAVVVAVLRLVVSETWSDLSSQQAWPVEPLVEILEATIRKGEEAFIGNTDYLRALGWPGSTGCSAGRLWRHLIETTRSLDPAALSQHDAALELILEQGPLARRILNATGQGSVSLAQLHATYTRLCDCLAAGRVFTPAED